MRFPKVILEAYAKIWSGKYPRIIIKAPRGGGKSKLLGTVGFDLWYLRDRAVVNMAGSLVQAEIVYGYFTDYCDMAPSVSAYIDGTVTMTETCGKQYGNAFSCVTASPKSVRGKHPDVLISDETCETSDDLVHSALPMVNDSQHPLVILASTFHKIFGIFQETWDNAEQRGYHRIQWDIFDVCEPFPADYWENGVMTDGTRVADVAGIDRLKKHAKGRTGDPEGWIPVGNIVQGWREKPTEDWFEVEYLGSRPSAAGLVLRPEDVDAAIFDIEKENRYNYVKGAECVLGVDWGFSSMTAVVELMAHLNEVVVQLDSKNYHQIRSEDIIEELVEKVRQHNIRYIYADSAGKFENMALMAALSKAKLGCTVVEVVFAKEKFGNPADRYSVGMIGNYRAHFEQKKIKIPNKIKLPNGVIVDNQTCIWQHKRYRYQVGTDKPEKVDDHYPDATMCALQHFVLGRHRRTIPGVPAADSKPTKKPTHVKPVTAGLLNKNF